MRKTRFLHILLLLVLAVTLAGVTTGCVERGVAVSVDQLPAEALDTLDLIHAGGPFPYKQDGAVFYNREGLLPQKPDGYYHEYTVKSPGSSDRGRIRIVTGKDGEYYYTDDHYESFRLITGLSDGE